MGQWGARPPRVQFSAPSRKTPDAPKSSKRSWTVSHCNSGTRGAFRHTPGCAPRQGVTRPTQIVCDLDNPEHNRITRQLNPKFPAIGNLNFILACVTVGKRGDESQTKLNGRLTARREKGAPALARPTNAIKIGRYY